MLSECVAPVMGDNRVAPPPAPVDRSSSARLSRRWAASSASRTAGCAPPSRRALHTASTSGGSGRRGGHAGSRTTITSRPLARSRQRLRQGYLSRGPGAVVRVRLVAGQAAFLTVKSDNGGISRAEFEYAIPAADAEAMLADLCRPPLVEKTRHEVPHAGLLWQVDEFHGGREGLVLAEVELGAADQLVELPDWTGREVTDDMAYRNSELSLRPDGGPAAPSPAGPPPER